MAKAAVDLPPGQRSVGRGEHVFAGQKHVGTQRKAHLWMEMTGQWGTVVGCSVCGLIRRGETVNDAWEAIVA